MVKLEMPIAIVQVATNRTSWNVEEKHNGRASGSDVGVLLGVGKGSDLSSVPRSFCTAAFFSKSFEGAILVSIEWR
jgi:hypothetical protein